MYGRIAHSRVKPGHEPQVVARLRGDEGQIPGAKAIHLYRMDADPSPSCEAVVFESEHPTRPTPRAPGNTPVTRCCSST